MSDNAEKFGQGLPPAGGWKARMSDGGSDPDYSPEYQDEYQRLWHESAARVAALEAALDDAALALDAVAALVSNYHVRPKANGPTFKPAEIAIHAAFVARAALAEGEET